VEVVIKERVRGTPQTVVGDAGVHDEVDRSHSVGEMSHRFDVSAPLTPAPGHLDFLQSVLTLVVVWKRSVIELLNCQVVGLLYPGVCSTRHDMVTECIALKLLADTPGPGWQCGPVNHKGKDLSESQRLVDQASSLR